MAENKFKFEPTFYLNGKQVNRVKRSPCPDCSSDFWFDDKTSFVCAVCAKTVGKNSSDYHSKSEMKRLEHLKGKS